MKSHKPYDRIFVVQHGTLICDDVDHDKNGVVIRHYHRLEIVI